jgi:hypothetical protein
MRLRVKIRYRLKLINSPMLRDELKNVPEVVNMAIFRQPQATNFPATNDEWQTILRF